jgi:hypothetical protein
MRRHASFERTYKGHEVSNYVPTTGDQLLVTVVIT